MTPKKKNYKVYYDIPAARCHFAITDSWSDDRYDYALLENGCVIGESNSIQELKEGMVAYALARVTDLKEEALVQLKAIARLQALADAQPDWIENFRKKT